MNENLNGVVVKANVGVVAYTFIQVAGIDYLDTFVPTPCTSPVRLVLTVALKNDHGLYQCDAEHAFVQLKPDTDI